MILVFVILAGMWVLVLVPPFLKNRATPLSGNSIEHFQRQLLVLERTGSVGQASTSRLSNMAASAAPQRGPRPPANGVREVAHPRSIGTPQASVGGSARRRAAREAAKRRRRVVLYALFAAVVVTFGLWVSSGGIFLALNVLADVLLMTFIGLLIRSQRLSAEREMEVAFLPHRDAGAEPTVLLRQTVNR